MRQRQGESGSDRLWMLLFPWRSRGVGYPSATYRQKICWLIGVAILVVGGLIVFQNFVLNDSGGEAKWAENWMEMMPEEWWRSNDRIKFATQCTKCSNELANCIPSSLCPVDPSTTAQEKRKKGNDEEPKALNKEKGEKGTEGLIEQKGTKKEAYVFVLTLDQSKDHKVRGYIEGIKVALYSLIKTAPNRPIVVVIPEKGDSGPWIKYKKELAWLKDSEYFKVMHVAGLVIPHNQNKKGWMEWAFQKLVLWKLPFDRIVFADTDILFLRNVDELFDVDKTPAMAYNFDMIDLEVGFRRWIANSGLIVLDPHPKVFHSMVNYINLLPTYDSGDQGFINTFFPNWFEIPGIFNFIKWRTAGLNMTLLMEEVKAIHYVADKPFSCESRIEDCNEWDYPGLSGKPLKDNALHQLWWKMYDALVAEDFFS